MTGEGHGSPCLRPRPSSTAVRRLTAGRARTRPAWPGEVAVVAFLLVVYDRISDLAHVRVGSAVAHARALLSVERTVHLAVEEPLDHVAAAHPALGAGLALYYDLAHVLVTTAVLVALYVVAPAAYRRARSALVLVNVVALVVFVALPLAPPRLLPGAGFTDIVARSGTWSAWQSGPAVAAHANEYASMPSLHVAWALWVVLAVRASTARRLPARLAVTHLALTVGVVLLTGNHYLLDAVAGALLTAACWAAVQRLGNRRDRFWRRAAPTGDRAEGRGVTGLAAG